jgi:NADPH:quinone reductase-like Zn-dependent oxidoreductase
MTMTAVRAHAADPDGLRLDTVPVPEPAEGEVLVRVRAAGITRDELSWAADRLPAIPSYEVSGTVARAGGPFAEGDRVFGMTAFDRDGVAAEFAAVPADRLAPLPDGVGWAEAAAVALPGLSALQGLVTHGHLEKGQRVLIHGGAGGVGAPAVQLAHRLGAYVIATASGDRVTTARELGADEVIDASTVDFTTIDPVDLVFDTAGGDRLARSPAVLKPGGRLVSVAEEPADGVYFLVEPDAAQLRELATLLADGALHIPVAATYPLADAPKAFAHLRSGAGKVVLLTPG